ncbi:MAG: SH3 domain-containing protein [Proteobacteria bacterium]|nr:SH3 domain-containing protein [Pseudomonadota bacterium]
MYYFLFCLVFSATASSNPIPRFVSLKAKTVNLHVGPGLHYPIEWKFVRQFLPVEVIAEFDTWRQIRDSQGTQGWVHKSLLSSKRTVLILNKVRTLYKEPDNHSSVVAKVEAETIAKILECRQGWCRINAQGYKGWLKQKFIWGVYPHEERFK